MTEQILIDYMAHRGDGVANSNEGSVYVPYTLPGETVTVEIVPGHPDRRHLLHVDKASPERIEPFCPHFGICGGCAIQHWRDDRYRAWKHQLVVSALRQAGLRADVTELIDAHGEGRRRMVLHARRGTHEVLQVGFSALSTHTIVPIDHCPVSAPGLEGGIAAAWTIAECLKKEGKPLDIQLTESDTGIDVDIRGSGPLSTARLSELARLSETHKLARITRHGELVLQRTPPTIRMGRAIVTLPPGSFLQATAAGEETLAERAIALCGKSKTVMDLFCGIGPFALRLAERARVIAYDSDLPSIEALRKAVATTPKLKPVIAEARDLFRRPLMPMELKDVDAVVFDPPRQGAEAQARQLAASRVPLIVAVSCNPATFVRDAAILVGGGYRLGSVTPVDQFKHTPHVELVAAFTR